MEQWLTILQSYQDPTFLVVAEEEDILAEDIPAAEDTLAEDILEPEGNLFRFTWIFMKQIQINRANMSQQDPTPFLINIWNYFDTHI